VPLCQTSQGEVYHEVSGSGPPLVLLHADAASGIEYASVVGWLSQQFQVIVIDNPGCGRSPRRAFSHEYYKENAKAAIEVMKKQGDRPAWVIGNGGGAVVGLWTAILAPSRVTGVVADSFVEFHHPDDIQKDLLAHKNPTPEMIAFWREMNGEDWGPVISGLDRIFASMAEEKRSLFNWRLEEVQVPVLATGSRKDHLISDISQRMVAAVEQLNNARLLLYPEGGHPSMWSQAESFWPDALAFIKSNPAGD
jgi:pimeloyl-ACP methyl ester carboxylesterase